MRRIAPAFGSIRSRVENTLQLQDLGDCFRLMDEAGEYLQIVSLSDPPLAEFVTPEGATRSRRTMTVVSFKRLSQSETDRYIASGEWRDKAGGYAIQGLAAAFVKSINGCYFNVVGLPLHDALALLAGLGFDLRVRSELIGAPA